MGGGWIYKKLNVNIFKQSISNPQDNNPNPTHKTKTQTVTWRNSFNLPSLTHRLGYLFGLTQPMQGSNVCLWVYVCMCVNIQNAIIMIIFLIKLRIIHQPAWWVIQGQNVTVWSTKEFTDPENIKGRNTCNVLVRHKWHSLFN